jgi:hypothetical protein
MPAYRQLKCNTSQRRRLNFKPAKAFQLGESIFKSANGTFKEYMPTKAAQVTKATQRQRYAAQGSESSSISSNFSSQGKHFKSANTASRRHTQLQGGTRSFKAAHAG